MYYEYVLNSTDMSWSRSYRKLVLLGDSITQWSFCPRGWGARLADHFQRRADVINRGLSGYNSDWLKRILPELLPASGTVDYAIVLLGSNDCATTPQQHVSLDNYSSNLAEICSYLQSLGLPRSSIVIVSPPPLCDHMWEDKCKMEGWESNRKSSVTRQYAAAALQAGRENAVTTVDLHSSISETGDIEKYLSDGLHLSSEGDKLLADILIPVIEGLFERDGVTQVYPDWLDVDWKCPDRTFGGTQDQN